MKIFKVILNGHPGMKLKEIADASDMTPSKVHRYMVSMIRSGLLEQNPNNSLYDLGPLALNIGVVAVSRLDRIQAGIDAIAALCTELGETTALSIWTPQGPIVVKWEKPNKAVTVSVATGTSLSMVTTAAGRTFGAFLPVSVFEHLLEKELASADLPKPYNSRNAVDELYAGIRKDSLAVVKKHHLATGVASIGAPVFNADNEITLVLATVGFQDKLDTRLNGPVARKLRQAALNLSKKLGYRETLS